ncbi:MAG TPA: aminotransferase class III-fold pyridoxal phosphate-dependent enzyme [Saprospiraceae bacterium]|nr:aminotransferase class III-fold pyridoxal phosphate-dependent enzyme [Saprospiraceae bacterium]HPI05306.1 aminotransferase class III-fold pyridoxal phosphate-dependent enzyme [Saprospiraceae bacterium]
MKLFDVYPLQDITIDKARGAWVWDTAGRKYLDMYGGHAVISIGHTHPHYVKRVTAQLKKIGFYSNSVHMPIQEELAEKLGKVSGKPDFQLFLCNSGAEANENALKLASFATDRKKVVAFTGAFHGRTSLAVAATDNAKIVAPVNETDHIIRLPFNDTEALKQCFSKQGKEIAAVITEGIQGVGGIQVATDKFLQQIRKLCDTHGAVFIADSVQCGYGRSGRFFSHDFSGVRADIYSVAKGMGNGFPVAGILVAPHLKPWHGMLGTTFGGNPLACAAALAVLEVLENENLMENATAISKYLTDELSQFSGIREIRGQGLMIGLDMPAEMGSLRQELLSKQGVFTGEAKPNVIRLLPSLALTRQEAGVFLKKFGAAYQTIHKSILTQTGG